MIFPGFPGVLSFFPGFPGFPGRVGTLFASDQGSNKGLSVTKKYLFHRNTLLKILIGFVTSRWTPRTSCGKTTYSALLHIRTTCFINE